MYVNKINAIFCRILYHIFYSYLTHHLLISRVFIVKPRIDRTNLKPIVIRAGKGCKYDVNVRGEPPPEIKWILQDTEVFVTNK